MFCRKKKNSFLSIAGIVLLLILAGACVPQRKVKLLQENANVKDQGQADELLKTINLQPPVYTLKPGDILSLFIRTTTPGQYNFMAAPTTVIGASDPILTGYTLDENGNLNLPVVGNVNLLHLSMPEARAKITEVLSPYFQNLTINLRLLTFRYTIIGEVSRQGQYTSAQDNLNMMEALALAGGFTNFANRGKIRLIRYEEGQAKIYNFSMLEENIIGMKNFYLQPNDMVVVDPLPVRFFRENVVGTFTLVLGLFSTVFLLLRRTGAI